MIKIRHMMVCPLEESVCRERKKQTLSIGRLYEYGFILGRSDLVNRSLFTFVGMLDYNYAMLINMKYAA